MLRMKRPTPFRLIAEIITCSPKSLQNLILGCPLKIIPDEDVFRLLLSGASFFRWGDGETAIVRNKSIYYQKADIELRQKLIDLSINPSNMMIVGLPWVTYATPLDKRWNKRTFGIMFSTRVYWAKKFKRNHQECIFSRTEFWWNYPERIPLILKDIQKQGRQIVLVGPKKFLKLCPKNTDTIEIPQKDAFLSYQALSNRILEFYEGHGSKLTLVVAAGPTAKALVKDFADKFQVIDIGHGFDFAYHQGRIWSWSTDVINPKDK
jgi:hypothetical protein